MQIERIECIGEIHFPMETGLRIEFILDDAARAAKEMARLAPGSLQMIYMDPPFNTGQEFHYRQRVGARGYRGDPSSKIGHLAYVDRLPGGQAAYLDMMRSVLCSAHRLLDPRGSIYVHVDYRVSAHIRLLLDEVFGQNNFVNEIIWHYRSGGRATRYFSRKHDTIFLYRKGVKYRFNALAAARPRGKERRNHLKRQTDMDGRTFFSIRSNGKVYRYYEDAPVFMSDVWDDIPHLQQRDPERTQYDTQKPRALLERMLGVSSDAGDAVADLFCGSGTTLEAAARLERSAVGIDDSVHALNVCRKRLRGLNTAFRCTYSVPLPACAPVRMRLSGGRDSGGRIAIELLEFSVALPDGIPVAPELGQQLFRMEEDILMCTCDYCEAGAASGTGGMDAVDYMALGFIKDGLFHAVDAHARSVRMPVLERLCLAALPGQLGAALHVVDVLGHNHYFKLTL